ncbi:hypothetical protein LK07_15570 [Streptomyces pluripotens]|uniref:DUF4232 domain-containing protein n=1 Tax=Streptomyces pluripotens TaxID=1355015 RepID=A0A221NZH8_9ACTN|nr:MULTISPECIES: hypothetical protein [Streptomyces]ARP70955.1 hypothetical protein LK06_014435 [Streptomyces pluripotens]ASN25208.1 hypothetical protein LK07_15570 [Streptomyces pluripotens]KIE27655.1 hypothetical protein LK08_07110 [Streptomyces sp. MUSC 125]MCH0559742.1 hypothetical protein [Streptomyces sp. MUM 16J]
MNHGPDGSGPDGFDSGLAPDELALRRLLHSAVDDIEPSAGTLEHLLRAVPARRARKRQAAVGAVAAALFLCTAVPALVHVSNAGGSDPNTAMAGESSQAQGGTGQGTDKAADSGGRKDSGSATAQPGRRSGGGDQKGGSAGSAAGVTRDATPSSAPSQGAPMCTAAQLGSATGSADAPDSVGVVYGTFQVTNISSTACTVGGEGAIGTTVQGAPDPAEIATVRHTAGDAATALPDPTLEVSGLVLQPGAVYEEKFAFVPSAACPAAGGGSSTSGGSDTGAASPDPTPSQDAAPSGGTASGSDTSGSTSSGVTTQLVTEDGTVGGGITVTHTPQPGSPAVSVRVPDACAGTVYYTGVLAGA